jgi:hypothetical protein
MKKRYITLLVVVTLAWPVAAQMRYKIIDIPDISGYRTLKCDFHIFEVQNLVVKPGHGMDYQLVLRIRNKDQPDCSNKSS